MVEAGRKEARMSGLGLDSEMAKRVKCKRRFEIVDFDAIKLCFICSPNI